ncbi:amino acid/amide ABC transporter membrane protein 1 (HAAT family) [Rhizobium sp. PP-F2F-G38]|uniref:Branched-chain amino acid ABC transporter permease n=1 Tax=Ferranicluibacter rubi TaxID=2715133 RepID=A0AA43ZI64_9HYPH|nr:MULTISPECIES: branched-chain amino acid ABC transporter permease [Rhizobiaceae]PYE31105.1 amino acid/amide ABC transporter membrane protein 1 (HAAT family) [Rhizobium sp. PP-WC-1G-195]PYE94759.1 amino acid/amide ABC transporter membrane protein 1 (HAAT family) [Rhizobium sp. PP-F2F-G38]TCP81599.1 amino acid/amide ABC transporter membrane protein 1 (HAAT family) [Rhizobium sp. PP-CC-2G-626]TCQ05421.1 amino acid/amide ABC transporter membrane protein 1 (HAAT family) [Rhizobium sp. PP-F2F-G36]
MSFFLETLITGLFAGLMYALVAIGFVLIYKASGVFNFAQGAMVFLAALAFVTLVEHGFPFWIAFLATAALMVVVAILVEALVLRPLRNRDSLTLFMATLGLSFVIDGTAQFFLGTDVHMLDLGIDDIAEDYAGILISHFDIVASLIVVTLVAVLAIVFSKTRMGVSLRAVADDTLAAQSIGIRLPVIWRIVWSVAGLVALVAGLLWGARQGVQFSLSLITLKALPVLIIGGFSSIPGAIAGGLIVGASEALADIYLGPLVNGSVSTWFAYILAVAFLLIRPAGLFGDRDIERV